jgi:hypothetical protein
MSKRLVKRLSPAGKPGNLTIRQRTVVDASVVDQTTEKAIGSAASP